MKINLKKFREEHRLFQSEIAKILGVNQSNVSRAELKGFMQLSYPQLDALYKKFGKEDVDSYMMDKKVQTSTTKESEEENGEQNKSHSFIDAETLQIIKQQSVALSGIAAKQTELTDRLIVLLEKLSDKI